MIEDRKHTQYDFQDGWRVWQQNPDPTWRIVENGSTWAEVSVQTDAKWVERYDRDLTPTGRIPRKRILSHHAVVTVKPAWGREIQVDFDAYGVSIKECLRQIVDGFRSDHLWKEAEWKAMRQAEETKVAPQHEIYDIHYSDREPRLRAALMIGLALGIRD